MSIQWKSRQEEKKTDTDTIITTTKTPGTNMVTAVIAYHIKVADDVYHCHFQITNGHTDTLNDNLITPWCLESNYYICHYYGCG